MLLGQVDVAAERGEPVPEPRVDRPLRGEQRRERLAALVRVRELALHQLRQRASTAMGRQHADCHHTGGRDLPPSRNGRVEEVGAGAADDLVTVKGGVNALGGEDRRQPLCILLLRSIAEVVPDWVERASHFLGRTDPDLERH